MHAGAIQAGTEIPGMGRLGAKGGGKTAGWGGGSAEAAGNECHDRATSGSEGMS